VHITYLGHAQLFINAGGGTLLVDPWFAEPVFGGAWFRYPPPPYPSASTMPHPNFLLLSHIHPDHSGPRTLEQLAKDLPTYALPFPSGALKRRLERAQFTQVHWLDGWRTQELAPGLKITFVPHDRGWEVSSIVIEGDGVRVYHGNDNPLSLAAYQEIVTRLGPIDVAFLPFAGASSYPTGFDGDAEMLAKRCAQKKAEGISRFVEGIEGLRPAEAAPFASSWALLEESELWKNFVDRPTPDEALAAALPTALKQGTHLMRIEPGDEWMPQTGVINKHLTTGWGYTATDVARYAKQERARVNGAIAHYRRRGESVPAAKLSAAVHEYFDEMLKATVSSTSSLLLTAGFVAEGVGAWHMIFRPGHTPRLVDGLSGEEDETLTLTPGELWALLTTTTNWEDVWYGYRLHVTKRPGAGYYRAFWEMLLNFDAELLSERLAKKYATTTAP
jgi:L-ascorbate metabolism protein UlaG (beta-lactamase superfamily)